ncbi:hypothetical protein SLS56_003210 [Neofusicoccum ribis]|uniref:Uncharacterized protein n=1 Tax=Neofusicoccum ribis TaxID=45134 RepID=A0ABR3T043_9PEZI
MASLASILHHGSSASGAGPTTTTRSTSSKSTPAPISTSSPMGAQQHQHTSPPPGIGGGASFPPPGLTAAAVHPLSPTTAASAAHVAVQDLPFYHQLEQVQRVRDGKFQASPTGAASAAAAAAAALDSCYQTDGPGDESTRSLTPTGAAPGGKVFERQIEEVEDAKEALRKAGVVTGAAQGQWGQQQQQQQQQQDFQVKVQVQGDGHAKMRVMGAVEEADRDEGVRV